MTLQLASNVANQNGMTALADPSQVALRKNPMQPDPLDSQRVSLLNGLWRSQDAAYRTRDREIEENVRMLVGQQWSVYNPMLGRWIDVSQFLSEDEKKWRQRPVFNRLLPWYMLQHSRMTENQPIVTFVPGPDRLDAQLAETLDAVMKAVAREVGQADVWQRIVSWLLVAGVGYAQTRFDPTRGEMRPRMAQAEVPLVQMDEQGNQQPMPDEMGQPMMVPMPEVPLDEQGNPVAVAVLDPQSGEPVLQQTGEAFEEPEGQFVLDPLSPLEVRGEWGPQPWHLKAWHMTSTYVRPEKILADYGVDVKSLAREGRGGSPDSGELSRLLYGAGYYGSSTTTLTGDASTATGREGLVNLKCLWVRPQSQGDPGRFLCAVGDMVLYDGPRPANFPYTSPIRCWTFAEVPGRQGGTAPITPLVPVQRAYNRRWAQLFDHAALQATPKPIIDDGSGLTAAQWNSKPGVPIFLTKRAGVSAVDYLVPPPIGSDVWRIMQELRNEFDELGFVRGSTGSAPTADASGGAGQGAAPELRPPARLGLEAERRRVGTLERGCDGDDPRGVALRQGDPLRRGRQSRPHDGAAARPVHAGQGGCGARYRVDAPRRARRAAAARHGHVATGRVRHPAVPAGDSHVPRTRPLPASRPHGEARWRRLDDRRAGERQAALWRAVPGARMVRPCGASGRTRAVHEVPRVPAAAARGANGLRAASHGAPADPDGNHASCPGSTGFPRGVRTA